MLYVLLTLAADIANAWLDPRIRRSSDMTTILTPSVPGAPTAAMELSASTLRWRRLHAATRRLLGGGITTGHLC